MPDINFSMDCRNKEVKHSYDAYVSHGSSERDKQFVKMLTATLEQGPYNFNIYLPGEDLIDSRNVKVISDTIKHRCKRLLLVMSQDYAKDMMSEFTVHAALNKPNCRRDRVIIPIVIDRHCGLPEVINHLTSADFTIPECFTWVLSRLSTALRAPISNIPSIQDRNT